ncbi:hypothetical protein KSE_57310 [Kitasatospora setae KM-6054]|uniref:Lipoprotein n=1 Tax=Kitasatospora setae (strain ATCC 33774 / DSM 43861 / JCM 3304 / KCC A-0304 / NBRC 14216 / KM-6054) TaxID=452652 RepID=E4N3M3_KITSK|nr:hypothetical protein KSE_57310 [Kitasatospora setae KM-6054]
MMVRGRAVAVAAVCGAVLAGAVGCTSDGRPAAAASPSGSGSGSGSTGKANVKAVDVQLDARVARMREWIEAQDDTVRESVRLVHQEGAVGFLVWSKPGGQQCLGRTEGGKSSGRFSWCDTEASRPLAEQPGLKVIPDGRADGRWYVQVDADRQRLVGVECGGERLKVVPIGDEFSANGARRHYLVFSDWQLTGRPVAHVLVDGGQPGEAVLDVPQEPVGGGLPSKWCG